MSNSGRLTDPSYELIDEQHECSVLYREHGFPHSLVRWHYHREYELHLITESSGKVFVGDYIGTFYPGHLVLVGPNLPHNWISHAEEGQQFPNRDKVVTFNDELVQSAKQVFPEMESLSNLLERAQFGIEFFGDQLIERAHELMNQMSEASGLTRLSLFLILMELLAKADKYKILSSNNYLLVTGEKNIQRLNLAVNYIVEHYARNVTLEEVAEHVSMKPTYFSKFFRQATGRRFIEFVTSLRISKACELLSNSEKPITDICFEAGFNNISNFNRRFIAAKNMTPSDYRKETFERASERWSHAS
ncbi:AraC family transcriptional regulator [Pokkaliibacter sp. CJK22405]|uniref:AraC family transcriptional regulator n=1 Tax=Pokkaliibacter sp. CJK22405 TaxID=3384615 RepID=UPI0039855578